MTPSTPTSLQHELGKRAPFDSPAHEAALNIVRTAAALSCDFARLFKQFGLSAASYNVLRILRGHHPAGIASQQIGPMMVASVPDVTRLVDRLADAGLAERCRTEQDRRVVIVRITRKGLDLLARLDKPVHAMHESQLGHMTHSQLATLSDLLVMARQAPGAGEPDTTREP
ncbi:MAG: MarR family transcriptional regulator [Phycisphaeraceae bacterium]|nr:MarR family transcriptional regulator [Phycisphaeraceae bacterium]